jgi:hypothetical protein
MAAILNTKIVFLKVRQRQTSKKQKPIWVFPATMALEAPKSVS